MRTTQQDEQLAQDALFLPDAKLKKFAATVPTPFHLYDEAGIRARVAEINRAFSWHAGHRQFFPVKAAPVPGILALLRSCGCGVLCTSELELRLAQQAGFSGREILFFSVSPQPAEAALAASLDTGLLLNGAEQMAFYLVYGGLRDEVGIRLRMDDDFRIGGVTFARRRTDKFGSTQREILSYLPQLHSAGVQRIGLHAHFGSGILKKGYYGQVANQLAAFAAGVREVMPLAWLDLGGGLGLGYRPSFADADLEAEQPEIRRAIAEHGLEQVPLYTELGRWLMGPNGILVTKVLQIRPGERRRTVLLDCSTANLLRMTMHHIYYHVSLVGNHKLRDRESYDLVGLSAEHDDRILDTRLLPKLRCGDLLAVHMTGAYEGHAHYGGRLGAAAYLYDAKTGFRCIRKAESADDYLRQFEV